MFWQSIQLTFEIFCSHVVEVGTGIFQDQTHQINGHFGYISTELNGTKGPFVMFMGHIGVPTKEARQRYIFISAFCRACGLKYAFSLCLRRCYPKIIASFAFAEKPF
jgi:hypothetical protein